VQFGPRPRRQLSRMNSSLLSIQSHTGIGGKSPIDRVHNVNAENSSGYCWAPDHRATSAL
jgi:hypothetical protein